MKISIKYYVLSIMGILLLYIIHTTNYIIPAYAVDSTPSADIRVKLEELKKQIASKAAKLKQEVNNKLKDKAYIGKVKQKSDSSLTLATKTGPKIVTLNQDTVFENSIKSKTKFSQKSISEEDFIVTLGDIDETAVLTAKKVILLQSSDAKAKTYLWGQIVAISDKLLTLKDKGFKSVAVSVSDPSRLKVGNFVILTGSLGKNEIFEAEFAYVIPQGGFLKPKKIATPSAKTATPSSKKKVN